MEEKEKRDIIKQFESERLEWTYRIKNIASRFKIVENLVEVQVDLYSSRQEAVDYIQNLTIILSKLQKKYDTEWKVAYDELSLNQDFRYNDREKARFASEKISNLKINIEILQSHIEYFKETVKTIDNMIFGVKHRIDIEDFKRGIK